jgi:hypothetical protein
MLTKIANNVKESLRVKLPTVRFLEIFGLIPSARPDMPVSWDRDYFNRTARRVVVNFFEERSD